MDPGSEGDLQASDSVRLAGVFLDPLRPPVATSALKIRKCRADVEDGIGDCPLTSAASFGFGCTAET